MIEVLIVADIRMCRDGLAEALGRRRSISVLGTAADLVDAVSLARALCPDVILVQIAWPDSVQVVRTLAAETPEAKIVALCVPEAEDELIACVEAGAAGYVTKEASLPQVVAAVERIARGEVPSSPRMTAVLLRRVRELAAARPPHGLEQRLTPREGEIVALIDEGLSNKQIAQALHIEQATVKNHVHHVLQKLHVGRRGEAAAVVRHRTAASERGVDLLD